MAKRYTIYMDVCCFNRPFDDWTQARIRLEAEAVLAIAAYCQAQEWNLIRSAALESEIGRTPDLVKKQQVLDSLAIAKTQVSLTETVLARATELVALSFKSFDALHIACAEAASADVFLTTDDRLIRKAANYQSVLRIPVANPVNWIMEVSEAGEEDDNTH
ncbi:MAG: PIN domain-containing protein [Leptolyngbyaceae cyanobacterium]